MRKRLRLALLWLGASSAVAASAPARAETDFEGAWETPYGKVKIEKSGDQFVGRLSEPARVCGGARAGTEVLRGRVEDDVFTGEVRLCYGSPCHEDEWVFAMAASVKNPERITGAVGTTPHSCQSQFLGSTRNFTFQRPKPADHAVAPLPPAPTSRAPMKPEARKLFSEGVAFLGEQQPDRALRKFMSAEEIDPRNSSILMNIGVAHKMRREYPQARNYFQQAIRADKTDAEAHYNLACVLALENRTKEAMDALRNAIRYGFDDIKTLEVDSDIESLRALPGFEELKRQAAEPRRKGR